jgi:hypothetical protein
LALATAVPATREKTARPVSGASMMGKYLLGWLLGVPVVVLVIIYLIFN